MTITNEELRRRLTGRDLAARPSWLPPVRDDGTVAPVAPVTAALGEGALIGREGAVLGRRVQRSVNSVQVERVETWTLPDGTLHRERGPARRVLTQLGADSFSEQVEYYRHGRLDRVDGPSRVRVYRDGAGVESLRVEEYHRDGVEHRQDGPQYAAYRAVTLTDYMWARDGRRHRDGDLPAGARGGRREHWVNGRRHRDGGRPAVLRDRAGHSVEYWVRGRRHRDGGLPAIMLKGGTREYYEHGVRHRDGGLPAVERTSTGGTLEWWVRGQRWRDGGLPTRTELDGVTAKPDGRGAGISGRHPRP